MILPLVPSLSALVVGLPLLDAFHITSELVTIWSVGTLQEKEMDVVVIETTLTLGSTGGGTEGCECMIKNKFMIVPYNRDDRMSVYCGH